jgi:hypothetical protein
MTQSTRYTIGQALFGVVSSVATANSAAAVFNPPLPLARPQSSRTLFLLDRGDRLLEQPQQREKRRCRFVLGALVSTTDAHAEVDELHFAARMAIQALCSKDLAEEAHTVRETEVEPELRDSGASGALLLSAYEIDYRQVYPAVP